MTRTSPLLALVLSLGLLPSVARAADGAAEDHVVSRLEWTGPVTDAHRTLAGILRSVRRGDVDATKIEAQFATLAGQTVPVLLDVLEQGRVPRCAEDDAPQLVSEVQATFLESALLRQDPVTLRAELATRLVADPDRESLRIAALRVLGLIGHATDLPRLAHLAPRSSGGLSSSSRKGLRQAYASILRREPGAGLSKALGLVRTDDLPASREYLLAAGEVGDPRALAILEWTARSVPALAQLAISIVPEVGRSGDAELDRGFAGWLADSLSSSTEWTCAALRAVGALDDGNTVPTLVATLESDDPQIVAGAHDALRAISGLKLDSDPTAWLAWQRAEENWWTAERPKVRRALGSPEPSEVLAALTQYGERRLYRETLAEDVLEVLQRRDPNLQVLACETLERLGARCALAPLVQLLAQSDRRVAAAAWKAASAIAGHELPRDPNEAAAQFTSAE